MMTMSYANNNNNNSCLPGMNVLEFELGDIYSAPEIMHNIDVLSVAKQLSLKNIQQNNQLNNNNNLSECSSTDCSSNSDEELEEFQRIVTSCSAKNFIEAIQESNQSLQQSEAVNNNNSCVRKYQCLKPSIFNPERENILAKQVNSMEFMELPSLEKRVSYLFEKVEENYYKIALMNCALKYNYPEELKLYLSKKSSSQHMRQLQTESVFEQDSSDYLSDAEDEDINNLSEEELLQDLYSAPEIL